MPILNTQSTSLLTYAKSNKRYGFFGAGTERLRFINILFDARTYHLFFKQSCNYDTFVSGFTHNQPRQSSTLTAFGMTLFLACYSMYSIYGTGAAMSTTGSPFFLGDLLTNWPFAISFTLLSMSSPLFSSTSRGKIFWDLSMLTSGLYNSFPRPQQRNSCTPCRHHHPRLSAAPSLRGSIL